LASSKDIYNIKEAIRRRLQDEWFEEFIDGNDARCFRILSEWPDWMFENWVIPRPPKRGEMPTRFHPCADRVLIKPDTELGEKRTASGLVIIPDVGKTRPNTGKVVAIGPDVEYIEEGEKVLFGKYAGADIKLNDEEMVICRGEDILGVITEEPDEDIVDQSSGEPDPAT
jgi:chaperonin GroES